MTDMTKKDVETRIKPQTKIDLEDSTCGEFTSSCYVTGCGRMNKIIFTWH